MHEIVAALTNQIEQIFQELIFVLIRHALDSIVDVTSVVLDNELSLPGLEVRIRG